MKRENMEEFFGASLLYGDSNNRMLNEEGDWILDRCEVCGKFFEDSVTIRHHMHEDHEIKSEVP